MDASPGTRLLGPRLGAPRPKAKRQPVGLSWIGGRPCSSPAARPAPAGRPRAAPPPQRQPTTPTLRTRR
eukprot:7536886-Lingulodinium_polyedra.AAC.1